ncbi:hypothetical protein JQ631_31910 [Bradyrhizobium manausense]|jgi:hypothetical protein|uniref:hypothetical protein n=1 Tax=Bradyrhizobium manausense TaxID=989370 RepID=UPI001BAB1697|nr:hypothetical protein [Bradyrhizobium manausense]MBR0793710.1 hypothetical protein [Bradyrhizobium manausense]
MITLSAGLLRIVAAILIVAPFTLSASGQTTSPPPVGAKKPTVATPRMIEEAIQRSQARTVKERDQRVPEQFGSEEPFTYVPGKTN